MAQSLEFEFERLLNEKLNRMRKPIQWQCMLQICDELARSGFSVQEPCLLDIGEMDKLRTSAMVAISSLNHLIRNEVHSRNTLKNAVERMHA